MTENQALRLRKTFTITLAAMVLGAGTGGAWKSVDEYYDLTYAFVLGATFAAVFLAAVLLGEERWPTNERIYRLRRRLKISMFIAFLGGPLVSFLGALPVFLIRLSW